jgi:hypothetical protein
MPEFHASFYHFTGINNTIRLRDSKIYARVSDMLAGAPEPILAAIAHILVAKLYRERRSPRLRVMFTIWKRYLRI